MAVSFFTLTDSELMQKVANYESRALEVLYNRYAPIMFSLVRKIVGDEKNAEEILIDIFVMIWRKIHLFDQKSSNAYTWLITLARNKAVDSLRRLKSLDDEIEPYSDEFEEEFIIPKLSKQIDDLDLKTALGIKENIENSLHRLTDAQQYVIYLAYYEGLTETEIASKLKIPIPTVKSKIQVALTNLKDNLLKGDSK